MRYLVGFLVVVVSSVAAFAQPPTNTKVLGKPDPEVHVPSAPVDLPAIPAFEMPASEPGFVGVHQLRVAGRKHLDTEVKVKGYVVWVYDCVLSAAKRGESRAATQKRIDADPTICERAKFYLGQTAKEQPAIGLWIVDVPRPPNKLERERLPKEEIAAWPKVPKVKVGDFVVVTGKFAIASPHAERNSDGLVVFAALEPAKKPPASKPAPPAPPTARPAVAAPGVKQVTLNPKDPAARDRSIKLSNEGTRAYGAKNHPEAIAAYTKAIAEWPGNHIAYYGLAGGHIGTKNWVAARDAMAKALELEPNEPMYNMVYGYVLYESAIAQAREAEAKKMNVKPDQVSVDVSTINFDRALMHLAHAAKLEPGLWRAHYYIGRIHRDRGEARWAAESFDAALRSAPTDPGPWVALGELYRTWHFTDQAITVAKAGTANVTRDASDVWYVLAMSYDDKRDYPKSIEAFTKALDAKPDNAKATFQRGQALFRKGDFAKAKIDLEAYLAAATGVSFAEAQANKMLLDIAARKN